MVATYHDTGHIEARDLCDHEDEDEEPDGAQHTNEPDAREAHGCRGALTACCDSQSNICGDQGQWMTVATKSDEEGDRQIGRWRLR